VTVAGWGEPPAAPAPEAGEVDVWLLDRAAPRPLETIAARYLGRRPDDVVVARSPAGKPAVEGSPYAFSLAHSGEVALVAVGTGNVGVDVEAARPGVDGWTLVGHVFTAAEQDRLAAVPGSERSEAVLAAWSRKEALLKAVGVGLVIDPRLVELDGERVVAVPTAAGTAADWTILDLTLPGHVGAVARHGAIAALRRYRLAGAA